MFAQLLRWSLILTLWKRYQKQALALLLLIAAWLLVGILHQDYIEYVGLTKGRGESSLAWSFLLKWGLNLGLLLAFVFYVRVSSKKVARHSPLHEDMAKAKAKTKGEKPPPVQANGQEGEVEQDAFANIRAKSKLRSKADLIIEKTKKPGE